jgi:hypothetical protein
VTNTTHKRLPRHYMLDLYGGSAGVAKASRRFGLPAYVIDMANGARYDITANVTLLRRILRDIHDGRCVSASIATACGTFSTALRVPFRTEEYPWGRPDLAEHNLAKVVNANDCIKVALKIVKALRKKRLPWVWENPRNSRLWKLDGVRELVEANDTRLITCDQCSQGAAWKKRTGLLFGGCDVRDLHRVDRRCSAPKKCPCEFSGRCHVILTGRDDQNVPWTQRAATYPAALARNLAYILTSNVRRRLK